MKTKIYKKILRSVNENSVKQTTELISKVDLSEKLISWIKKYNQVGQRGEYIWKWLYHVNLDWKYIKLQKKLEPSLAEIKTLYNMFIVLLDDVAEEKQRAILLGRLLKIPLGNVKPVGLSDSDRRYFLFAKHVWSEIVKVVSSYPFFENNKECFMFDSRQFLNAVSYANLIFRKPHLMNKKEYWLYIPHSMQILIDLDLDLMCVPNYIQEEIGSAREVVLVIQEMGRIGNWLSTWEREVRENDFTSLVVPVALERGLVNYEKLRGSNKDGIIKKISDGAIERVLLEEWERRYSVLEKLSKRSKIINQKKILEKARYLLFMHMISRGYK